MALPNTEKLTSQLSMMPDPALKRMAMMYKNDPYIFPLVIAEDGRRKQLRTAGAAAQAQPQPKVADQEIAQMAGMPETVGIGQLPAPNLTRMADGGIVAFEEGGEVERFQSGGTSTYSYRPYQSKKLFPETTGYENMSFGDMVSDIGSKLSGFFGSEEENVAKRRREAIARENARREAENAGMRKLYETTTRAPYGGREPPPPMPGDKETAGAGIDGLTGEANTRVPPTADTPAVRPPSVGSVPKADFSESIQRLSELQDRSLNRGLDQILEMKSFIQQSKDNPAYKTLEAALDKEEAASAGEKDKAAGLALLMAGLGIAGGSSQYALQNLKEAIPAVKEYSSEMRELKKLDRERMKMRSDIEQFRRAEDRDDRKAMITLKGQIADRQEKIDEKGIDLVTSIAKTDAELSAKIWQTMQEQAGANYRTQAQLSQEPAELRTLKALQRDPKLMEAYTRMQQTRGSGLMGLLGKYADPAELEILRTTNPALYAQVLSQMQAALGGGFTSLPQGATVLPPK